MARIRLDMPPQIVFRTTLPVRITDINYGNHLGNDRLLGYVHEARLQFLKSLGFSELKIGSDIGMVMSDAAITYKKEAFHGDELTVEVAIGDTSTRSIELFFRIRRDTEEIAIAKTGLVGFSYHSRGVALLPEPFAEKIRSLAELAP